MSDRDQLIAARAYEHFLARGGEHGHDVEDWLAAEAEIAREPVDVVLADPGPNTIQIVRAIRDATGMGLTEVHALLADVPGTIERVALVDAERLRAALEPLGARVELRTC